MSELAMQSSLFSFDSSFLNQQGYLLVVNPELNIVTDVKYHKKKLSEVIGSYPGKYSLPHITVASFLGLQDREQKIIKSIRQFAGKMKPSMVYLEDFKSFPSSGTIYIQPKATSYFSLLSKSVYPLLRTCNGVIGKTIFISLEPHLTIARNLKKEQFEKAKDYFNDRQYQNSFRVNSLTLLRKNLLKEDTYYTVAKFDLNSA